MSGNAKRFEALMEILAVGFAGWLITVMVLTILGLQDSDTITRPPVMALFLVLEATITLALVVMMERASLNETRLLDLVRLETGAIVTAVAVLPVLFFLVFFSGWFFQLYFPQYASQGNPLLERIRTPLDLFSFLLAGVYAGGIKEEVQRVFILLRFEESLGGIYTGLAIWSVIFGLGHYEQGWSSAFSAALLGLVFGGIFIWKRNLFASISIHAVYNVAVLLIYWFYFRA